MFAAFAWHGQLLLETALWLIFAFAMTTEGNTGHARWPLVGLFIFDGAIKTQWAHLYVAFWERKEDKM